MNLLIINNYYGINLFVKRFPKNTIYITFWTFYR